MVELALLPEPRPKARNLPTRQWRARRRSPGEQDSTCGASSRCFEQALQPVVIHAEQCDPRAERAMVRLLGRLFLEKPMPFALAARCVELVGELRGSERNGRQLPCTHSSGLDRARACWRNRASLPPPPTGGQTAPGGTTNPSRTLGRPKRVEKGVRRGKEVRELLGRQAEVFLGDHDRLPTDVENRDSEDFAFVHAEVVFRERVARLVRRRERDEVVSTSAGHLSIEL